MIQHPTRSPSHLLTPRLYSRYAPFMLLLATSNAGLPIAAYAAMVITLLVFPVVFVILAETIEGAILKRRDKHDN